MHSSFFFYCENSFAAPRDFYFNKNEFKEVRCLPRSFQPLRASEVFGNKIRFNYCSLGEVAYTYYRLWPIVAIVCYR